MNPFLKISGIALLVVLGFILGLVISTQLIIGIQYLAFIFLAGIALIFFALTYFVHAGSAKRMLPSTVMSTDREQAETTNDPTAVLPPDKAREWLDEFLVKQQTKE